MAHRTIVSDPRRDDRCLRVAWHPDQSVVVLSHWRDDLCVATSAVALADVPRLMALLADAVGDADFNHDDTTGTSLSLAGSKAGRLAADH